MQIAIVAVGKLRPAFRELCDDYARRLRRYVPIAEHEVREASRSPSLEVQRSEEARRLDAKVPRGATVIALAREGHGWTSMELSSEVRRWQLTARPVALLIGGSQGLAREVVARAGARWSLGSLTLPHELARVIVYEQLYRAFTILRAEPYHKGR